MALMQSDICDFGWQAPDFNLPAVDGKNYSLADLRGAQGLVIVFGCNHCPYVQAILDNLISEVAELAKLGVNSAMINANDSDQYPEDSFENMAALARRKAFNFPYLHDASQEVARAYDAICTPDFFGFNADLQLQYRGRLDASGRQGAAGARRELFDAMSMVAETGKGPSEQTPSMGCSIKWR